MGNGFKTVKSFEAYNLLTSEQKEFYHFEQLSKIDGLYVRMDILHEGLDDKYSKKWVEKITIVFLGMILLAFAGIVISGVIPPSI